MFSKSRQSSTPRRHQRPAGQWNLHHHVLRPSQCLLQTRATQLLADAPHDLVTLHPTGALDDDFPASQSLPRALLRAAGGPLAALSASPVTEYSIHESSRDLAVLARFLRAQPLTMTSFPPALALLAHRWQLQDLFSAFFLHAEERLHSTKNVPALTGPELLERYVPIMRVIDVPDRFKRILSLRIALDAASIDQHYQNCHVLPEADELCDVPHDKGVVCQRRKRGPTLHASETKASVDDGGTAVLPPCTRSESQIQRMQNNNRESPVLGEEVADGPCESALPDSSNFTVRMDPGQVSTANVSCSETPERLACFEKLDLWNLFRERKMIRRVLYYMAHFANEEYIIPVLDAVLRQLGPCLSNEEILQILANLDWDWNTHDYTTITDGRVQRWSARSWRLFSYAHARAYYTAKGNRVRMTWEFHALRRALIDQTRVKERLERERQREVDSSAPERVVPPVDVGDYMLRSDWGRKACDGPFQFSMTLTCFEPDPDNCSTLALSIRLLNGQQLCRRDRLRKVYVQIKTLDAGCCCDLDGNGYTKFQESIPYMGSLRENPCEELRMFQSGGETYTVMRGEELKTWLTRHSSSCGLVFHVKIYIMPRDGDQMEKVVCEREVDDDDKKYCTCGFCECEMCSEQERCDESQ